MSLLRAHAATLPPQTFVQPEVCGVHLIAASWGLVGHFEASAAVVYKFHSVQKEAGLPVNQLIQNVSTEPT